MSCNHRIAEEIITIDENGMPSRQPGQTIIGCNCQSLEAEVERLKEKAGRYDAIRASVPADFKAVQFYIDHLVSRAVVAEENVGALESELARAREAVRKSPHVSPPIYNWCRFTDKAAEKCTPSDCIWTACQALK